MQPHEILDGKRILIVDDEPDILDTIEDLLDTCRITKAKDFMSASKIMQTEAFDAVVLDIMGVAGYDLLDIAVDRQIPAVMLTAHALSADHFIRSIRNGAYAYLPKDKLFEIDVFLARILASVVHGGKKDANWLRETHPLFERKFGTGWHRGNDEFWQEFSQIFAFSRQELEEIL